MLQSGGLIIATKLLASSLARGPWCPSSTPAPPTPPPAHRLCKKVKELSHSKWVTTLHFRDTQSDHSIAMMGVERASLIWYLCHGGVMDTVLNTHVTSMTTRLHWSASASLPLHPYTTRGSTAQGPCTVTLTNGSFFKMLCDFLTLVFNY